MKLPFLFATAGVALACCAPVFAVGEGYTNFVRQTQQTSKVVWDMMGVAPVDSSASQLTLEAGGAVFTLWTINQATNQDYLLDTKTVGVYLPTATITIATKDPYTRIPRTRADQPFTVTVNVQGLMTPALGIPDAATQVLLRHHLAPYPAGTTSIDPRVATATTPVESGLLTLASLDPKTLNKSYTYPVTMLPGTDPKKINGEEHFVVHALADGILTQTQIASALVQVWPMADGTIAGVNSGTTIRFKGPDLTVTANNLYPSSTTWVQVYGGPPQVKDGKPVLVTGAKTIPGSQLVWDSDVSRSTVLTLSDYDSLMPTDGTYTVELMTQTPFGTQQLAVLSFNVDRTMEVRGLLGGLND